MQQFNVSEQEAVWRWLPIFILVDFIHCYFYQFALQYILLWMNCSSSYCIVNNLLLVDFQLPLTLSTALSQFWFWFLQVSFYEADSSWKCLVVDEVVTVRVCWSTGTWCTIIQQNHLQELLVDAKPCNAYIINVFTCEMNRSVAVSFLSEALFQEVTCNICTWRCS